MAVILEHERKVLPEILVTEAGIVIVPVRFAPLKALFPIAVKFGPKFILVIPQLRKQYCPIVIIELGKGIVRKA